MEKVWWLFSGKPAQINTYMYCMLVDALTNLEITIISVSYLVIKLVFNHWAVFTHSVQLIGCCGSAIGGLTPSAPH